MLVKKLIKRVVKKVNNKNIHYNINSNNNMNQLQRYQFDTHGYTIIKNVFSDDEINNAIKDLDDNKSDWHRRDKTNASLKLGEGDYLKGSVGRIDIGNILSHGRHPLFRSVLTHPKLLPYFHELLGDGYRLDHSPLVIIQEHDCEGFNFHGGNVNQDGKRNHNLAYNCVNGEPHCLLLNISLALTNSGGDEGGFCIIPGSHKSSFAPPKSLVEYYPDTQSLCIVPQVNAGDVILFTEAALHGTIPWKANNRRIAALYRFAPYYYAYGRAYLEWPESYIQGMSKAELSVMQAPFGKHLDRDLVEGKIKRNEEKKKFDKEVFGTKYY